MGHSARFGSEAQMYTERVIIALHDQFSGTRISDFLGKHEWSPKTEFHVAHVIEVPEPHRPGDPDWENGLMRARETAASLVGEFVEQIRDRGPGHFIKEHILEGSAVKELVRLAHDQSASLIIMGCRGRRGLKRLLLGSVSGEVASKAPCSVVILKKNHLPFERKVNA